MLDICQDNVLLEVDIFTWERVTRIYIYIYIYIHRFKWPKVTWNQGPQSIIKVNHQSKVGKGKLYSALLENYLPLSTRLDPRPH